MTHAPLILNTLPERGLEEDTGASGQTILSTVRPRSSSSTSGGGLCPFADEYKDRLAETAGVPVSRAAAVAKLLAIALDVEGARLAPVKRSKRKS